MLRRLPFILLVLLLIGAPTPGLGQVMAFKQGEVTTGMTKQCIYNGLGNRYTLTLSAVSLCPLSVTVPSSPPMPSYSASPPSYTPPPPSTVTAFYKGEETTGMTKQCYYDALGSMVTRTISSIALCPLSIQARTAP